MAFDHLTLVTVYGQALTLDGKPGRGTVTFVAPVELVDSVTGQAVFPVGLTVRLDAAGSFTIDLPATDDPGVHPAGWTYQVTVDVAGAPQQKFSMVVPVGAGPIDLFLAAPVAMFDGVSITQGPAGPEGPAGPAGPGPAVSSVAGRSGVVVLTKADVGLSAVDNTADIAKPVSTAQAALNATFVAMVAAPTGVSATDCANFAAALAALPSTGGKLILQSQIGGHPYDFTNGVTINKPCAVAGMGAPDVAWANVPTLIVCTSATATPITITSTGVTLSDFGVRYTGGSTPTAGAGIAASNTGLCHYVNLGIAGFYDNMSVAGGYVWDMRGCTLINPIRNGLKLSGLTSDFTLSSSWFGDGYAALGTPPIPTGACIRAENAQGFKMSACKVIGQGPYGVDIAVADGALALDYLINDSSIEGFTSAAIVVRNIPGGTNTGQVDRLQIMNNQFQIGFNSPAVGAYAIQIINSNASANNFRDISIAGNLIAWADLGKEIAVTHCNVLNINGNLRAGGPANINPTLTTCTNVALGSSIPGSLLGFSTGAAYNHPAYWPETVGNASTGGLRGDAFKIVVPFPCTVTGMAAWIGVATVGNVDFGIYDASGAKLASCGSPSYTTLTAGVVNEVPFTAPVTIPPGTYWIAAVTNSGGITVGFGPSTAKQNALYFNTATSIPGQLPASSWVATVEARGIALILG